MSIELLRGEEGHLRFGGFETTIYRELLLLAHKYGWNPAGTEPPLFAGADSIQRPDPDWDGNYVTNDFQSVNQEDAISLAAGLERGGTQKDGHTECLRMELIAFCRQGGFCIG